MTADAPAQDLQRPADSLPDELWDAIVVGAGPAGATAAHGLARGGRRVLLLERRPMPRTKPCGGAVSARAEGYLPFPIPPDLVEARCYGARVHYRGQTVQARLPDSVALMVTRSRFDRFLAAKAAEEGAQVALGAAEECRVDGDCVVVRTRSRQLRARVAIIASGAASGLLRHVRRADTHDEIGFCLEQDYPVMRPDPFEDIRDVTDVHFGVAGFGYGWVFHHGTHYSVGIGGLRSRLRRPMEVMRRFWAARGLPVSDLRPRGAFIPAGGLTRRLVGRRAMLVGDAAGFVDSFSGEGIAYAIRSGQLAAETAESALRSGDFSEGGLSAYAARCYREFGRDLGQSLFVAKIMHRYPSVFLRLLSGDRDVLGRYLAVPQGRLSYRGFFLRLLARLPVLGAKEALFARTS